MMARKASLAGGSKTPAAWRAGVPLHWRVIAVQVCFIAFVMVGFSIASWLLPVLPSVPETVVAGLKLLSNAEIYRNFVVTVFEAVSGFAIGTALGIAFGALVGASRTGAEVVNPIILAVYSVPKIIFLPLLMIVFGVGIAPKVANAAVHAFFPIMLNSLVGMREVESIYVKVAHSMSASRLNVLRKIYLPAMVLPVFAGMRLGLGLAFMGALLAELFESKSGVGYMVIQFYNTSQLAAMLAVVAVLYAIILAMNAGMQRAENWLSRWRRL